MASNSVGRGNVSYTFRRRFESDLAKILKNPSLDYS